MYCLVLGPIQSEAIAGLSVLRETMKELYYLHKPIKVGFKSTDMLLICTQKAKVAFNLFAPQNLF